MPAPSTDSHIQTLQEVRRLLAERAAKKKELDALDRAIEEAVGVSSEERPKRPPLSKSAFRSLCRGR